MMVMKPETIDSTLYSSPESESVMMEEAYAILTGSGDDWLEGDD